MAKEPLQIVNERLGLMRQSTWRIGDIAAVHLDLALASLEVSDDHAFHHHTGKVVNAVRAMAKLANEMSALRSSGGPK
jgi:hypothetical protein